jgi:hypothetical protein
MDYKVRFMWVRARDIINTYEPPEYRIKQEEESRQFFTKLEASIRKEGVRNPVNLIAQPNGDLHVLIGGSRTWIAQKLDIMIPAVITDKYNLFPDAETLKTEEQVLAKFKDKPLGIEFTPRKLNLQGCPHCHL